VWELMSGPQSAAQRYAFFAERQAICKIPDVPGQLRDRGHTQSAYWAAGTMGAGMP